MGYHFFTGSTGVGRIVSQAAAPKLTPVILELGGKSPCIVDSDADIEASAKKIAWAKFFNCAQTCVAPDYLIAHESIKDSLLTSITKYINIFFGDDPQQSPDYGKIISPKHHQRLIDLLTK